MEVITTKEEQKPTICRVCLNFVSGEGLSLFEKHNNVFIFDKINYISGIEIEKGSSLPDRICATCLSALDDACSFKQKCEDSDAILHSTLPLGATLQFIKVPIKLENENEHEHEYLNEHAFSLDPQETQDYIEDHNQSKERTYTPTDAPFKSKAIDLKLVCHDCGNIFKTKCKLRVHWKKEHQPKQLVCPNCKKAHKTYKSYHSHLKRKPKSCLNASKVHVEGEGHSRMYHCNQCDAKSKRLQTIITHLVVHTGERPYSCNICNKTFTQHSSMSAHKEKHHNSIRKEGTCHLCGKHFERRYLYRHMITHRKREYPCNICSKVLGAKSSWHVHMKRHSGVKAFTCEWCAKSFYTSSDLCNHRTKSHLKNKVFKCDLCNYKTVNHGCMLRHRPRHNESNVSCDVCGTFLENTQQLLMHKKRHFEKNLQCLYCSKKFYGRKNLTSHLRKLHKIYASNIGRPSAPTKKLMVKVEGCAKSN